MTVSIGVTSYESFRDAIFKSQPGDTIKVDSAMTEDVEIFGGRTLIIDLNGQKITNKAGPTIRVFDGGVLTIVDPKGSGVIDNVTNKMPAILVDPKGTVVIKGGAITRSAEDSSSNTANYIKNLGTTTISEGAEIAGTSTANATIKSGFDTSKVEDKALIEMLGYDYVARLAINGGTVTGAGIAITNGEYSNLAVSGGEITGVKEAILNWADCSISEGIITSSGDAAVIFATYNGSGGAVRVTGGKLSGNMAVIKGLEDHVDGAITPVINGGMFKPEPDSKYYSSAYEMIDPGDGFFVLRSIVWDMKDEGVSGMGFSGMRKLIIHRDSVAYASGGIPLPVKLTNAILVNVTTSKGDTGYYDRKTNKVKLFSGAKEHTASAVEDITIIMLVD